MCHYEIVYLNCQPLPDEQKPTTPLEFPFQQFWFHIFSHDIILVLYGINLIGFRILVVRSQSYAFFCIPSVIV